jgi:hypothetical protein
VTIVSQAESISKKPAKAIDESRSLSVADFCRLEGISGATYYKLKRMGLGPRETRIPGTNLVRITVQDRLAWHAFLQEREVKAAADREHERRRHAATRLAKLAVASPNHVSKVGPRRKRA